MIGFLEPYAQVFGMTVEGCFRKGWELLLQALRLHPVCAHLTTQQVREMGGCLLEAHRASIPWA